MLKKLIITATILLLFGFALDLGTTYLLFKYKYPPEEVEKYEINPYAVDTFKSHGPLGVFYVSPGEVAAFLIVIGLGSFVTGMFFFNEFREDLDYFGRVAVVICIGFMMLATMRIGAGINGLICLIF